MINQFQPRLLDKKLFCKANFVVTTLKRFLTGSSEPYGVQIGPPSRFGGDRRRGEIGSQGSYQRNNSNGGSPALGGMYVMSPTRSHWSSLPPLDSPAGSGCIPIDDGSLWCAAYTIWAE